MGATLSSKLSIVLAGAGLVAAFVILRPKASVNDKPEAKPAPMAQNPVEEAAAAAAKAVATAPPVQALAPKPKDEVVKKDKKDEREQKKVMKKDAEKKEQKKDGERKEEQKSKRPSTDSRSRANSGPLACGSGYRLNVKNLTDKSAGNSKKLKILFEEYGTVVDAQVKTREDGKSMGIGFVVMNSEAEGQKAIEALNGKSLNGKKLFVSPAERRKESDDPMALQQNYTQMVQQAYMQHHQAYMQQAYMAQANQYAHYSQATGQGDEIPIQGEYCGKLKVVTKHGKRRHFLVCDQTYQLYNRDIFVGKEFLAETAKDGDLFKFTCVMKYGEMQTGMMAPPPATGYPKVVALSLLSTPLFFATP